MSSENIIICDEYSWHVNSNLYTSSGTYTDTVFNSNGCDSIITLNLTINKSLSGYDSVNTCYEYLWPINNNKYTFSGTFFDTIISSIGCDSIVHLILGIENITFFAPNSFTPNQDEHNELFRIVSAEAIAPEEYFEIRIFNRWGKKIYHSNDIEKGWDGALDGNFMQQGVYVWEIQYTCRGKIGSKIGTVTLIH